MDVQDSEIMAQNHPTVQEDTLMYHLDEQTQQILLGTSEWYAWLDMASTFTFRSAFGTFTARKERAGNKRGGWYWKAYRKHEGKLFSAYLGKSEELTLERLRAIAAVLAGQAPPENLSQANAHEPVAPPFQILEAPQDRQHRSLPTPTTRSPHPHEPEHRPSSRRGLPAGTITLLFTDIEGSTLLLQRLGERYAHVLTACRHLLRTVFAQYNGSEVDTQGDAFFAVFARATDAVSAAVAAQRALASHGWPEGVKVGVRMGLHTGEPERTAEGYVGLDVHHAARMMSSGHGGQVLLSQTTRDLVEHDLPEGVSLCDLGAHHLKDLQQKSHLFQLVIGGLPADFPPLKTLDVHANNLPIQLTPLVGREQDTARVCALLRRPEVRLVTLTGTGGVGKTRLALSVAAFLHETFADGTLFAPLAAIRDPGLLLSTLAEFLGLRPGREPALLEHLSLALHEKHLLVLLDNFEQLLEAAPQLVDLLQACPRLKLLVTSRAVLHVQGEYEYPVMPLALPDRQQLDDLQALSRCAAVTLFVQRVQTRVPGFSLTPTNARAVAEICLRLDGLPLALELAAARSKLLPPQALLGRLSQRLALLTSPALDVPARQQTLRNTLDWSYALLDEEEQRLLRRLSVFVGGCQLQAVEAVCTRLPGDEDPRPHEAPLSILDTVGSLLDKSLVQQTEAEGGEPRLTMLETIREYGWECLQQHREAEAAQRAHALYHLAFAEEAAQYLRGGQQGLWRGRLQREQENLRAALGFLIEQQETELAVQLGGALWLFWYMQGSFREGRNFLERALGLTHPGVRTEARARALCGAGALAFREGNYTIAAAFLEESEALYQECEDSSGVAQALLFLALVRAYQRNQASAGRLLEQSMRLCREAGDRWLLGWVLDSAARIAWKRGDAQVARAFLEESVTIARQIHQDWALSSSRQLLAAIALAQGEYGRAVALAQEMLIITQQVGDKAHLFDALFMLGEAALRVGDEKEALARYQQSLALAQETGDQANVSHVFARLGDIARQKSDDATALAYYRDSLALARAFDAQQAAGKALLGLAHVSLARGQYQQAVRLFAAAEERLDVATEMDPIERAEYARGVAETRAHLGEQAYLKARDEARHWTLEQAQTLAGQVDSSEPVSPRASHALRAGEAAKRPAYPDQLTAREVEVLRLVAEGLSDPQVAERLVISPRTAQGHMRSIFNKIGVNSRAAATRYAIEHKLV